MHIGPESALHMQRELVYGSIFHPMHSFSTEWLSLSFGSQVVFLHKPSRSLIATDLFWSYPSEAPAPTKLWKQGMDRICEY